MSRPKRDERGQRSCSEHMSIKLCARGSRRRKILSSGQEVSAFLMLELGNLKATMKMTSADL